MCFVVVQILVESTIYFTVPTSRAADVMLRAYSILVFCMYGFGGTPNLLKDSCRGNHGGLERDWIERIAFNTLAPAERSARVCLKVDSQVRAYTVVSHLMLELKSSFTCSDSTLQR